MGYIPSQDILPTRNKCISVRSHKKEKNHVDMNFHMENMEHAKAVGKEMKKAIRKLNRLLGRKISFTITVLSEQSD